MVLVEVQTIMPYPIEDVFALTVDLEKAPHWHNTFTDVKQLTTGPAAVGSQWKLSYGVGSFDLEITDYRPPNRVVFKGSKLSFGIVPKFTVELERVDEGTQLVYKAQPYVPLLLRPLISFIGVPWGKRDLQRYFREFEIMLAAQPEKG